MLRARLVAFLNGDFNRDVTTNPWCTIEFRPTDYLYEVVTVLHFELAPAIFADSAETCVQLADPAFDQRIFGHVFVAFQKNKGPAVELALCLIW
jgi:hypothetical protein